MLGLSGSGRKGPCRPARTGRDEMGPAPGLKVSNLSGPRTRGTIVYKCREEKKPSCLIVFSSFMTSIIKRMLPIIQPADCPSHPPGLNGTLGFGPPRDVSPTLEARTLCGYLKRFPQRTTHMNSLSIGSSVSVAPAPRCVLGTNQLDMLVSLGSASQPWLPLTTRHLGLVMNRYEHQYIASDVV